MEELTLIIETATANVQHSYFQLNIDGGGSVYRERVYCYELYHQMRKLWPDQSPFVLNGELDKRAHPLLRLLEVDYSIPDFLVHIPGSMNNNHAIIEVKHSISNAGIRKDLETLDKFVRRVGYSRAIYLIYGYNDFNLCMERVNAIANERKELIPVELWMHSMPGQSARMITTIGA